jgi:hypothetical protein
VESKSSGRMLVNKDACDEFLCNTVGSGLVMFLRLCIAQLNNSGISCGSGLLTFITMFLAAIN